MTTTGELKVRKAWALARIGELVNLGRAAGWLRGDAVDMGDADEILEDFEEDEDAAMGVLGRRLGLGEVEMNVLWLLACLELEPRLARAAQMLMSNGMHELSTQIVERLVMEEEGDCDGEVFERLARFGLIETGSDPRLPMYRRPVRANDRVIDLVRGKCGLDRELADVAVLAPAQRDARVELPVEVRYAVECETPCLVVATGIEGSGRQTLLRAAAGSVGRRLLVVRGPALASEPEQLGRQLRAIARECKLHEAWPLLLEIDGLSDRAGMIDRELVATCKHPVLATSREACTWAVGRPMVTAQIALPGEPARAEMWKQALPAASDQVAAECARRYAISPGLLERTASAAVAGGGVVGVDAVHRALRVQLERRLLGLAQRIETRQTWDDLVLPVDQFDLLMELVARVKHRQQVLEDWGFAAKVGKGLGLSVLLSGPPGTGKTMIAGLLARELGLDLYQVDLSRIVSKYIGETEKQLSALFEAAESGHAILLFDEADSLFGKRTEVRSSNDRYANLEVNYLLQRMEVFSGISLLTTNHETAIDKAFQRRLALHIRVPMPDEEQRELLWRTMFPGRAKRVASLDLGKLAAEFEMSGGYIKNAVLRAAYFAADEGGAIDERHLWRAARAEYEAMGKMSFQQP
ncbi:MAG: AAA family ATPase [Kofleriaceae bacterium]